MTEYKQLVQCKLSSPCDGGVSRLTAFMQLGKCTLGQSGVLEGRVWQIDRVYTGIVISSEFIAWYKTFS